MIYPFIVSQTTKKIKDCVAKENANLTKYKNDQQEKIRLEGRIGVPTGRMQNKKKLNTIDEVQKNEDNLRKNVKINVTETNGSFSVLVDSNDTAVENFSFKWPLIFSSVTIICSGTLGAVMFEVCDFSIVPGMNDMKAVQGGVIFGVGAALILLIACICIKSYSSFNPPIKQERPHDHLKSKKI